MKRNATVLLGGIIKGDIDIPQTSFVNTTYDNSTILGNVVNQGVLHVAENRVLLIHGMYCHKASESEGSREGGREGARR